MEWSWLIRQEWMVIEQVEMSLVCKTYQNILQFTKKNINLLVALDKNLRVYDVI